MAGDFPRRRVDPGLSTSPAECSLAKTRSANKVLHMKIGPEETSGPIVDLQAEPNTLLFLLNLAVRVQLSLRILA